MNISDCYTTKEAAERLGKSAVTIGHYIRTGKLTPVEDLWGGHRGHLFEKSAVDQLKEELDQEQPNGMMTGEAAAYLGVTRATLQSYLQEQLISFEKTTWRSREVVTIKKVDLDLFQETHKERLVEDRLKQRLFYDRKKQMAFYQRFSSSTIQEARLTWNAQKEWMFFIQDTGAQLSFEEGIYKHDLTPDYTLSFGKRTGTPGYAKLSLPLQLSFTRQFLDLLYEQFDLSNVYMDIRQEENIIILYVKDMLLNAVENAEILGHFLESNIEEGFAAANNSQIRLESAEKSLSIYLPADIKKKIKQAATEQGTTMQEISKRIIMDYFK
ncbi:helix-turn-helix domain-containing protein [Domibacillus sp. PGB-M46]|uniref:helix-turn-helix domain-containing protein n=1 Tax=Domibacillus sp. PGB-M46 TaxID=2910255 RepID=UPI001F5A3146|nr:helix-turn-helix domain-containing protein [Domibacillus sp. PGB-M46]MCI2257142.1 helix-turn-helix domain-containing protein [Domibacillus sp. PGB-M46]